MIMAGAAASRMKKSTEIQNVDKQLIQQADTITKGMIGVGQAGESLIDYQLFNAHCAGFEEVLLVLHPKDYFTEKYYLERMKNNEIWRISIQFSRQYILPGRIKPAGTADAVLQAFQQNKSWQTGKVVILNSDNLYSAKALDLLWNAPANNALIGYDRNALGVSGDRISAFAVIRSDKEGYLLKIIEKPDEEIITRIFSETGRIEVSMNSFVVLPEQFIPYLEKTPFHPETRRTCLRQ